jgi:hypothetical protein
MSGMVTKDTSRRCNSYVKVTGDHKGDHKSNRVIRHRGEKFFALPMHRTIGG